MNKPNQTTKKAQDIRKSIADMLIDFASREDGRGVEEKKGAVRRDGGRGMTATIVANQILDAVQVVADEMALKATGNCDVCYGKGYNSYMQPGLVAAADFEGDKEAQVREPKLVYQLCGCERGRGLKKVLSSNPEWVDYYEAKE